MLTRSIQSSEADASPATPSLFVVILNWNGWRYTLPCLESVIRSDYSNLRILVCDNGSSDDSWTAMRSWASGQALAPLPEHPQLAGLLSTPRPHFSVAFIEEGKCSDPDGPVVDILFLKRASNGGYAAGNNAGIRLALSMGADYVWILNNDTVVEPSAARLLVDYLQTHPAVGMCGCTLRDYDSPLRKLTVAGSHFNTWTGRSRPLTSAADITRRFSYVEGASLCVRRSFLEQVGLLCEEYFLFCEELDWAARANGRFLLGSCPQAIVYHKQAAASGLLTTGFREYCSIRSCLLVTSKFWPGRYAAVVASMLLLCLLHFARARRKAALCVFAAVAAELGRPFPRLERHLGFRTEELQDIEACRTRTKPTQEKSKQDVRRVLSP